MFHATPKRRLLCGILVNLFQSLEQLYGVTAIEDGDIEVFSKTLNRFPIGSAPEIRGARRVNKVVDARRSTGSEWIRGNGARAPRTYWKGFRISWRGA
jgi:hypothetical protein